MWAEAQDGGDLVQYPTEPGYVYAVRLIERHGRSGIVADVDLGFQHWRRNMPLTLAGSGAARSTRSLEPGGRYVLQTARRGHERGFVAWVVDAQPAYTYAGVLGAGHDGDNLRLGVAVVDAVVRLAHESQTDDADADHAGGYTGSRLRLPRGRV